MLQEKLEPAWLDAFESVLRRCALQPGDTVAILCESQSRPVLPQLARLAAARLGCAAFTLELPSVFATGQPVTRSTGASPALQGIAPVVAALAASTWWWTARSRASCTRPSCPPSSRAGRESSM